MRHLRIDQTEDDPGALSLMEGLHGRMDWRARWSFVRATAVFLSLACIFWAVPASAQAIDLSAVNSLLESILTALTGTTGRLVMSIVAIFILLGGAFNFIDWPRVFTLLIIIVLIGVIPTVIQSIWSTSP